MVTAFRCCIKLVVRMNHVSLINFDQVERLVGHMCQLLGIDYSIIMCSLISILD